MKKRQEIHRFFLKSINEYLFPNKNKILYCTDTVSFKLTFTLRSEYFKPAIKEEVLSIDNEKFTGNEMKFQD